MLLPKHNNSVAPARARRPKSKGIRRDLALSASQPHIAELVVSMEAERKERFRVERTGGNQKGSTISREQS